ncbi:NAD-dependent epimerase/dehydratase family protein [Nocardia cyriacigeorgica]|uniref:NAD-dependent epimerase/dehydratase family protein n=1 Tax=Nocardia cyriacigeorgica TaxID=135487 RepID=UPI0014868A6E|nr:NAD-dependent epimerase/dehydratase family protein [Nocardia cyriacigeorgica]
MVNHVVVIGGAGFLGSHLCRALLERGDRVTAIDPVSAERVVAIRDFGAHPHFAFRCADITVPGALAGLGAITHVAHFGHGGGEFGDPIEVIRAASAGAMAAVDLAVAHGARIVIASGAHGGTDRRPCFTSRLDAESVRSAAELIAETTARHYPGARVGIARPFEVYGPHSRPGTGVGATLCAAALRDQTVYLDDEERSFVYVTDVVAALIALLDREISGPVDIGGPMVTLSEFARTAIALAGRGWVECAAPRRTGSASRRSRSDDLALRIASAPSSRRRPDLERTRQLLGWDSTTSLHEGVHRTLDWMRSALQIPPAGSRVR